LQSRLENSRQNLGRAEPQQSKTTRLVGQTAIVDAGFMLRPDSPDLGLGRLMMFKGKTDAEYEVLAELHVDAFNHAVQNIPADRMRLHEGAAIASAEQW
jgi:hypothetical protein